MFNAMRSEEESEMDDIIQNVSIAGGLRWPHQESPRRWQRRGPTAACAISLTSCPDSEERTGIRFEKERVYGYSGGAKALPGRPLAPAIAPIRGSRR